MTVKSLHIGPAVHEEKHSYSNLSRDDDTLTSSSHEDPHVVNLMTEAEKDSSNFQVAQEHSLIFAHAICSLLLSASSGLEASRFKRQVSSLANDVVSDPAHALLLTKNVHLAFLFPLPAAAPTMFNFLLVRNHLGRANLHSHPLSRAYGATRKRH